MKKVVLITILLITTKLNAKDFPEECYQFHLENINLEEKLKEDYPYPIICDSLADFIAKRQQKIDNLDDWPSYIKKEKVEIKIP